MVVALMGGLGNQMFQRAFGLALTTRGYNVCYNTGRCRDYSLDYFEKLPFSADIDMRIFEESLRYNPKYLSPKGPSTLIGFWQSEQYFQDIADKVRGAFLFKNPSLASRTAKLVLQVQEPDSVFVHVRRGDYVNLQHYHGMPSLDYYDSAVSRIRDVHLNANVFIFSDDPQWCHESFSSEFQVIEGTTKYEDLYLMSLCQHAVIANSSFGWWGAWLGDNRADRIVVAPKTWFTMTGLDSSDLVPSRWIRA
jgi:hypothetical protein